MIVGDRVDTTSVAISLGPTRTSTLGTVAGVGVNAITITVTGGRATAIVVSMLPPAIRQAVFGSVDAGATAPAVRMAVGTNVRTASCGGDPPRHAASPTSNTIAVRRMSALTTCETRPLPTALAPSSNFVRW